MSFVTSAANWTRQILAGERLIGLLFLLAAAGLVFVGLKCESWIAVLSWGVYFLALGVCSRQGWVKVFGPVLFYDMIRTSRRSRYLVMRLLYALLLLSILCMMYLPLVFRRNIQDPGLIFAAMLGFAVIVIGQIGLIALFKVVTGRMGRLLLLLLLAVSAAMLVLGFVYVDEHSGFEGNRNLDAMFDPRTVRQETARLAEGFFCAFMLVQVAVVLLLTPAYVAGAIAEEKDRKTLEFMLATDLRNREIVLSKLLSRLANMTLLLLTGLPILSLLQIIGGVDPDLMLAGFAGTGLTMLGVASISILFSTVFKKPRDAIGLTYLFIIAYIGLGCVAFGMEMARVWWFVEPIWDVDHGPALSDISNVVNAGNPATAIFDVIMAIEGRNRTMGPSSLAAELPGILARYTWFHLALASVCVLWSIARVRAIALRQTPGGTTAKRGWMDRYRPPIGDVPMIWKELHIEGRIKRSWPAVIVMTLLVLLTAGSGLFVVGAIYWESRNGNQYVWRDLPQAMNIWFRVAGTCVASLMILMVAVRASTSIVNERERDTFDALISTPMSAEAMLGAKLLGNLMGLRIGAIWYGGMLFLAVLTLGIHALAVPLVVTSCVIYSVFFVMVGMWYSMVCKSSMRATVYTVLTTLGLGGGHWLFTGMCCVPIYALTRFNGGHDYPEFILKVQVGLTPPAVIGIFAYSWEDLTRHFGQREFGEYLVFCLFGLFLWGLACLVLWFGVLVPKFKQISRREELVYD